MAGPELFVITEFDCIFKILSVEFAGVIAFQTKYVATFLCSFVCLFLSEIESFWKLNYMVNKPFDSWHIYVLELGPSLGSGSKFEPDFRLEVNKLKARARPSLIFKSLIELL